MSDVTRWELKSEAVNIVKSGFVGPSTVDPSFMWTEKDKQGHTQWEKLQKFAAEGWELVSVTPVTTAPASSQTFTLLYTFKRPLP
jgi:hypothetical protein